MDDPRGGHPSDLEDADGNGLGAHHQHAHRDERGVGRQHEQDLRERWRDDDGKHEASRIGKLDEDELPLACGIFEKEQSAKEVGEIKERTAVGADEQEVGKEEQASRALCEEKVAFSFKLVG